MSKLVVILGAGASADFGVPTLSQLFKDAYAHMYLHSNQWLAQKLQEIFWSPRGHNLATSDISLTIEEMLTILRDWDSQKAVATGLAASDLEKFKKYIYILIYKALFEGKSSRGRHLNKLIEFAGKNFEQTTWASYNWDCVFESSFWYSSGPPNVSGSPFGTRMNPTLAINIANWINGSPKHLYLKLHGSVNWWMINNKLTYLRFSGGGGLSEKWRKYELEENPTDHPVILEPSYYKYTDSVYDHILPQWNVFLEKLVDADYILIIGYSLPSADSEARCKMLTAFQANPKGLWGIIDPTKEVLEKYSRLFGRKRMQVYRNTLVSFNNEFEKNFAQLFYPQINDLESF